MAEPKTPAEILRRIADERLEKGSRDWAELHRISGYIEGVEEANRTLNDRLEDIRQEGMDRDLCT